MGVSFSLISQRVFSRQWFVLFSPFFAIWALEHFGFSPFFFAVQITRKPKSNPDVWTYNDDRSAPVPPHDDVVCEFKLELPFLASEAEVADL